MMIHDPSAIGILCYGFVFIHLGIFIFFVKKKNSFQRTCAAFIADYGMIGLSGSATLWFNPYPLPLYLVLLASRLLLAPLGCAMILGCLDSASSPIGRLLQRGIWIAVGIVFGLCCLLLFRGQPLRTVTAVTWAFLLVVVATIAVAEGFELRPISHLSRNLRRFYLLTCLDVLLVAGMNVAWGVNNYPGIVVFWALLTFSCLAVLPITFRHPEFYESLSTEAGRVCGARVRLKDGEVAISIDRLAKVMREDRLWTDAHLSANTLAEAVGISRHELSELLNQHLGRNFQSYVNNLRLEAAKELLTSEAGSSILEVAFACGFNSKSTFNAVFRKETGVTPKGYRERCVRASGS
jgi:AraC-like DNA-binding protein